MTRPAQNIGTKRIPISSHPCQNCNDPADRNSNRPTRMTPGRNLLTDWKKSAFVSIVYASLTAVPEAVLGSKLQAGIKQFVQEGHFFPAAEGVRPHKNGSESRGKDPPEDGGNERDGMPAASIAPPAPGNAGKRRPFPAASSHAV